MDRRCKLELLAKSPNRLESAQVEVGTHEVPAVGIASPIRFRAGAARAANPHRASKSRCAWTGNATKRRWSEWEMLVKEALQGQAM